MVGRSKRSRAAEFTKKARIEIIRRDDGSCIFCEMGYRMENAGNFAKGIKEIMHYIPRSAGGLGIPENGAVGCVYHHIMYDNGNEGRHAEMKELFERYLKARYPGWNEKKLVYNKWSILEEKVGTPG